MKFCSGVILFVLLASLCACGANNSNAPSFERDSSSSTELLPPDTVKVETESDMQENDIGTVTPGTEYYKGFLVDNILSFTDGTEELHYHIYLPAGYDDQRNMHSISACWDTAGIISKARV